jgi:hypothetical protein|tara:strand:+ start:3509 stop:4024 length:516 start_codon:yes stop_codon:yes gene_type:complete
MKETKNINLKLFELQNEIGTISKDATNPFYKSKYFDINSLIKQLQPLLKKHKLLLQQPIEDNMVVSKIICIEGGGAVLSFLSLPEISDPQKLGSCITYYRRYTLGSLLALQSVDDDGNLGSNKIIGSGKAWLNKNTPRWQEAVSFIKEGGDLSVIEKQYRLSEVNKKELIK